MGETDAFDADNLLDCFFYIFSSGVAVVCNRKREDDFGETFVSNFCMNVGGEFADANEFSWLIC